MPGARDWVLKIVADVTGATKGIEDVEKSATGFKDKMGNVAKTVATGLAVGAVVKFGKDAVDAAGELDDAMDGVALTFGNAQDTVIQFGKHAAENMGISEAAFGQMATKTGSLLTSMGIPMDKAAESTNVLSQRAADLATVFGTDVQSVMGDIEKGLRGSTKSLAQYGITMSKADIEARAMAEGYTDASGKVTEAGMAIAAQELILEQSADKAGQFAANSGDLGSQQAILQAKMQDLSATIGTALLPILQKLLELIMPIVDWIMQNINWIGPLVGAIAGLVLGIKAWTIAQTALNIVMDANVFVLVAAAIAGLVAGVIYAYTHFEWFRNAVDSVGDAFQWLWEIIKTGWGWVKDHWPLLLTILGGPIGAAVVVIVKHWDTITGAVKAAFNWVKDNWQLLLAIITGPIGLAVKFIVDNWDKVTKLFRDFKDGVNRAFNGLVDIIEYPFKVAGKWITDTFDRVLKWFRDLPENINQAFSRLADIIKYPFKIAIDAIKALWNSTVGGFGFEVPSWVPGVGGKGFHIPQMAAGGIVTRPTIALVGEAGPEAVVPLNRAGGFGNVTINVYALTANAEVGRQVYNALREYERTSGKVA